MSPRNEMGLPATCSVTLGSVRVMGVFESGCRQSSANPSSSSGNAIGSACTPRGDAGGGPVVRQSLFQWPVNTQLGQGLEGGRGMGHWRAQWLSFLHLKQAPGGVAFCGPHGCCDTWEMVGLRAATRGWVWRATSWCIRACQLDPAKSSRPL